MNHVNAWFVNEDTKMNPSLLYAQAIKGIATGRGIGIIDTVHLIEVAQSLMKLEEKGAVSKKELAPVKEWFRDYLNWMKTHPYGVNEMNATKQSRHLLGNAGRYVCQIHWRQRDTEILL